MEVIQFFIDLLRDPRGFIAQWIIELGPVWVYTPLFLIIFVETGLVVTPFLPGDSLLFCAGIFAADGGGLNIFVLIILMTIAAILGNTSNYWIGRRWARPSWLSGRVKALTPERIAKTQAMLDKYGSIAVFLTRFFPIIRTFAPFLAGMGEMHSGASRCSTSWVVSPGCACSRCWATSSAACPSCRTTSSLSSSASWSSRSFPPLPASSRPR